MARDLMPHQTKHSGRGPYERMQVAERILDARNRGVTMYEIAKTEGISRETAQRYLRAALEARQALAVDEFRKQQNDSLDLSERQIQEQMDLAEHLAREGAKRHDFDLVIRAAAIRDRAIGKRLSLAERRARLNGLDAPVQVQATVTHLDAVDAELADLVRQAEQAAEETRPGTGS